MCVAPLRAVSVVPLLHTHVHFQKEIHFQSDSHFIKSKNVHQTLKINVQIKGSQVLCATIFDIVYAKWQQSKIT